MKDEVSTRVTLVGPMHCEKGVIMNWATFLFNQFVGTVELCKIQVHNFIMHSYSF